MKTSSSKSAPLKVLLFIGVAIATLTPFISAPFALLFGLVLALLGWVPSHFNLSQWVKKLLAFAIVGMGFGIQLSEALAQTFQYLPIILTSIVLTLFGALVLSRLLKVHQETATLIGAGTAICGGSAIAATAAAIQADNQRIAISLGCVFILNAAALWIFPWIGQAFALSQEQFGVWAAIAIHDTSSVVAASSVYGNEALQLATTLKLARALFIIPMAFVLSYWFQRRQFATKAAQTAALSKPKVKVPLFIVFYVVAMLVAYLIPQGAWLYTKVFVASKQALVLCLFLIGASLSLQTIKQVGAQPFLLALALWVLISVGSLSYIYLWV